MRRLLIGWLALLVCLWVVALVVSVQIIPTQGFDFTVYLAAARSLRIDPSSNIYVPVSSCYPHGLASAYPPLLALVLEPLTTLSCPAAIFLWAALNAVVWLGVVWWMSRGMGWWTALIVPLGLFSYPLWRTLWLGQINLVLLLGMWAVVVLRPRWAGIVLGFITALKVLPAMLLLWFILRREWKIVVSAIATLLALCLVMALIVGPRGIAYFAGGFLAVGQGEIQTSLNASLGSVTLRLLALVIFVVGSWLGGSPPLGYAWALSTMLLASPLVWDHYLLWLLPVIPLVLMWRRDRHVWLAVLAYLIGATPLSIGRPALVTLSVVLLWGLTGYWYLIGEKAISRNGFLMACKEADSASKQQDQIQETVSDLD